MLDTVTSLGGIPLEVDGWGVDAVLLRDPEVPRRAARACRRSRSRRAPSTASQTRVDARRSRWYLDLGLIADYVGGARAYHHTAPISMVFALHAGLGVVLDEGLERVVGPAPRGRRAAPGCAARARLPPIAEEGHRLPQLTSACLPDGADDATLRKALLAEYGIEVGGGLGEFAGQAWRIGLMGHSARPRSVVALLGALRELL